MAEMTTPESGAKRKGKKSSRSKKMSTRVDLTAMVDLGFLLITFFMLATTFNKPKAMEVNKPAKDDNMEKPPEVKMSKTYTVLIGNNDKAYCYVASETDPNVTVDSTDFSRTGFRENLRARQKAVAQMWGSPDELFVLIKPLPKSNFRNVVNVLDEMAINGVKKYAIIDDFNHVDSIIVPMLGQSLN
jgi:biopolymer transport protein ExbD